MQDDIPTSGSECKNALAGSDGLVMRAHEVEMVCQKDQDLSQPMMIVESHCEGLSLPQQCQDAPNIAKWKERRAQSEPGDQWPARVSLADA